jgi:hypothetical protein
LCNSEEDVLCCVCNPQKEGGIHIPMIGKGDPGFQLAIKAVALIRAPSQIKHYHDVS